MVAAGGISVVLIALLVIQAVRSESKPKADKIQSARIYHPDDFNYLKTGSPIPANLGSEGIRR